MPRCNKHAITWESAWRVCPVCKREAELKAAKREIERLRGPAGYRCVIAKGWYEYPQRGLVLGPNVKDGSGMDWTPVLWDNKDDPEFCKAHSLVIADAGKENADGA